MLATAVRELIPGAGIGFGPSIEDGFYYDFEVPEPFTPEDLESIEKEITSVIDESARIALTSPPPAGESIYEDVYVRTPYVNMRAAEKDPAWRAAAQDDRIPEPPAPSKGEA